MKHRLEVNKIDNIFKALADSNRRELLDQLYRNNGQSLHELCMHLEISRQAVTKHLKVLEEANLIAVIWHGREKLHYLNPVPISEINQRWIKKYENHHLSMLFELKKEFEEE